MLNDDHAIEFGKSFQVRDVHATGSGSGCLDAAGTCLPVGVLSEFLPPGHILTTSCRDVSVSLGMQLEAESIRDICLRHLD